MITYLNKTVGELMTKEIISVSPVTIMTEVADIFQQNSFHHIPVLSSEGHCVGVISKQDFCQLEDKFTLLNGSLTENKNERFFASLLAKDVMSKDVVSLEEDIEINDALKIFLKNKVHSIVVSKTGVCKGILTPFDLLSYLNVILGSYQKAIV